MKNLSKFLIVTVVMMDCCFISCNKQENLLMPLSGNMSTINSKPIVSGQIFTVSPSGDYENDSYAIQTALNYAVAAGTGSTVQLTAGTFYLKYPIEIDGFDGYFKGAGKESTIITTHDQVNFDPVNVDMPSLLKFRHGFVRMSDLTFEITEPEPCTSSWNDWWHYSLPCLVMITGISYDANPPTTVQTANSSFDNVNFIGGAGNFAGRYNVAHLFYITSDGTDYVSTYALHGNEKFTNCKFQTSQVGIVPIYCADMTCIIGGSASSGNEFKDVAVCIWGGEYSNVNIEVSYNDFNKIHGGAIWLGQYYMVDPYWNDPSWYSLSTFLIRDNNIEIDFAGDGIALEDYSFAWGIEKLINATVSDNKIFLDNTVWGGIWFAGTNDIIATNNNIWGYGFAGIYGGVVGDESSGLLLKGNNVQGVNAIVAPIWLGPGTSNYTVIGGSNKTNVFDEGINNTLTGVNNMQGNPPSSEIREAMMRKHDMMKSFRGLRRE